MKKQLLILLLAFITSISASAYSFCVDGIYYNINGSEATVTSNGSNSYSGSVTIPASVTYLGTTYSVTEIGYQAFYYCIELRSVFLPNSVTSIGSEAFYKCEGLYSITIPESVTSIGNAAFYKCEGLYSISIPESVTSIGRYAFYGTNIPTVSDNGVSYIDNILIEASGSFKGKYAIKENTLVIADFAFFNCSGLTSIEMPYSLKAIGKSAFDSCTSLSSVTISNSVETIDEWAFGYCTSLNNINIPNSVTIIGRSAFNSCTSLESLNIPNSITEISRSAFAYCTGLKSLTIPESVTVIGIAAFYGCSALVTVTIPSSVLEISEGSFEMCSSLKSFYGKFASSDNRCLIVDGTLNSFAPYGLTTYSIPNSVTSIGGDAFFRCDGLTSVTIPNSVTTIGYKAFCYCTGLTSLTVENDNPASISLGSDVFLYVSKGTCVLNVPKGCKDLYTIADQWKDFTNIVEFFDGVSLSDGDAYTATEDKEDVDVSYARTFNNSSWQSLYVPFNMSYDEWSPYADVAKIHNIRGYDNDFDGEIDETVLEFSKLTSGELVPNVPYVIRPKETGTVTIECTGKNLLAAPAENGSVDCSSTEFVYALYGVYQPKSFSTPSSAPAKAASTSVTPATYTLMNGEFVATEADTEIPAGSIYLAITPKEGGYTPSPAPARIKISVNGEVPTSINTIVSDIIIDNACYDLMGRRVETPTRGIYIRGGKKVLVK